MSTVYYTLGVLIFFGAILASIGLHELGHMVPAKAFGGKVTQYFIGFGPTVWSKRKGETEYGIKAIPLGGYVKILGMLPPEAEKLGEVTYDANGNQLTKIRKSNTGLFTQLISDARAAEWELVGPEDGPRLFYKMPWWKKVVVMSGGPLVNIAIAFFLFWGVFAFYGNYNDVRIDAGQPVIAQVPDCVIPASADRTQCLPEDPISPAAKAGLQQGDRIVSFNGVEITNWDQLVTLIHANADGDAVIGYVRDGVVYTTQTNTTVELRPDGDDSEALREVGYLGITPTTHRAVGGPIYTVREMGWMAVETVKALAELPVKVWGVARAIVGAQERDPESPVSIVGGSRLAGEATSHQDFPKTEKAVFLVSLIAGFNFFIGMFNFIPLLPLDGGHIASAMWEAIRRGIARLRGRPDPGFVDAAKLLPVAYVVACCLLVMSLVLIIGDLVVPLHLT